MRIVIALPVLNEEKVIAATVESLRAFADRALADHEVVIVIADNGSSDRTEEISRGLASRLMGVSYLRLARRGKGLAIREAWKTEAADVYVFMDADLAVDLDALPELIARIGHGADLAIGSRRLSASVVERSWFRRLLSRGFRGLVAATLDSRISDMPCGFKAVSAAVFRDAVPNVRDDRWFFDTELVIRAERAGLRIDEIPVTWREAEPLGRRSRVRIVPLIGEYLTNMFRLRRELGPASFAGDRPSFTRLAKSVTRREWAVAMGCAAFVAALGCVAPLVGIWSARASGLEWTGRQFLSPGDFAVYLSYVAQAKQGVLLFRNFATTEKLVPVLNIFWLAVGLFAKAFRLSPLAAYYAARTFLIFPFAAVAYLAVAYVFRDREYRLTAFLTFMFGSGIGLYVAPFLRPAVLVAGIYQWPTDFWVAESNAFMTMLYSPHFIASFGLIIAIALTLLLAYDAERPAYGAIAGILGLLLFEFHPFHAPTLYLLALVALVAYSAKDGIRFGRSAAFALFLIFSAPSVAYQYWLTHWSPNAAFMLTMNITITPSPAYVAVGLGAVVIFAIIGFTTRDEEFSASHRIFFACWAVAQSVLIYAPFTFQRRLIEGLQFPLVILATPAILGGWKRLQKYSCGPACGVMIAVLLFLPSTFATFMRSIDAATGNQPSLFFFSRDETDVLDWMRTNTPADAVVLSDLTIGNDIIGWEERTTYLGHWSNTIDVVRKETETDAFFSTMRGEQRREFVAAHGITYVMTGPEELNDAANPLDTFFFEPVSQHGDFTLYKVRNEGKQLTSP
jgi:glycosyltransferase involved in cell wall biosynthesis